jgi:hypothetical protein
MSSNRGHFLPVNPYDPKADSRHIKNSTLKAREGPPRRWLGERHDDSSNVRVSFGRAADVPTISGESFVRRDSAAFISVALAAEGHNREMPQRMEGMGLMNRGHEEASSGQADAQGNAVSGLLPYKLSDIPE